MHHKLWTFSRSVWNPVEVTRFSLGLGYRLHSPTIYIGPQPVLNWADWFIIWLNPIYIWMVFSVGPHHYLPKGRYCTLGYINSLYISLSPTYIRSWEDSSRWIWPILRTTREVLWLERRCHVTLSGQENNS